LGGGSVITTEYALKILANNTWVLRLTGFKVNETIVCRVSVEKNSATVLFVSYRGGTLENEFGVAEHKPGAKLIEMRHKPDELSTKWLDIRPDGLKKNPGKYFQLTTRNAPAVAIDDDDGTAFLLPFDAVLRDATALSAIEPGAKRAGKAVVPKARST